MDTEKVGASDPKISLSVCELSGGHLHSNRLNNLRKYGSSCALFLTTLSRSDERKTQPIMSKT